MRDIDAEEDNGPAILGSNDGHRGPDRVLDQLGRVRRLGQRLNDIVASRVSANGLKFWSFRPDLRSEPAEISVVDEIGDTRFIAYLIKNMILMAYRPASHPERGRGETYDP